MMSTVILGSDSIEAMLIVVLLLISYNYTSYIVESLWRSMFSTYITDIFVIYIIRVRQSKINM